MNNINITNGVNFHSIIDDRFKTNKISIHFIQKISRETVTTNALIPQILRKGYKGCENFTMFNRELEELYGASVTAYVSKVGDYHDLTLSITTLDDKFALENEEISKKAAEILIKMAFSPIVEGDGFSEKDVKLEKASLIDTIQAELNEKRVYAVNQMTRLMLKDSPAGIPTNGFIEDIESITPQSAKKQYDNIIKNAKIEIMYVGCGGDANAVDVFKDAFANISRDYKDLAPTEEYKSTTESLKEKTERIEVNQSKLVMGFSSGVSYEDDDVYAMRLACTILGGTTSSKFFLNVREKLQLCYYCAARFNSAKGIVSIDSGIENDKVETAKVAILNEIEDMKKGNFTDDDMKFALLSIKNSLSSVFESKYSIESYFLNQIIFNKNNTPEMEKDIFDKITRDEVIAVAQKIKIDTVYLLTGKEV